MAKVTGPLFSVDARGKIADTLVFMGWRGLKTVRRWLKPANPRTSAQVITRGFFSDAVTAHHGLSAADKSALRTAASGQPYSGFNLWVGWMKSCLDAAKTWITIKNVIGTPGGAGTGQITISGNSSSTGDLKIRYGRTTALLDGEKTEVTPAADPFAFTDDVTGLIAGETYYFKVEVDVPNANQGQTGIYSFVAPAAA